MLWPLILGLTASAGILLWRMAYLVEWRRSEPGRHARGHVEPLYRDDDPPTEILPVIRDYAPYRQMYDPSFYRLSRAVRQWADQTGHQ
jgi:hypothetical protein